MRAFDKKPVSIPLYEFQQIYSRYCNINGFNEQNDFETEQNMGIFKAFGIQLLSFDSVLEPAYANIRMKNLKELAESKKEEGQFDGMNSVQKFLNEMCVSTKFKTDVLSFDQVKFEYDDYCKINDIPYSKKLQIIGSEDMLKFGAVVTEVNPPKRLLGIKKQRMANFPPQGEIGLLLRVPATLRSSIMTQLFRTDGLIPNVILAVLHFALILIVPILSPFIAFQALILIPTFQGDVFAKILTVKDFFMVNRMQPWWDNVPNVDIVLYIHIYVLVYLFFAYLEIFAYYLTGYYNNGKYAIKYSFMRRLIMLNFYIGIGFFLFLYLMMLILIVQWGIIGAIFNPTVLLPYSAAIVTFIATVGAKFNYFRNKYENLAVEIEKIVKEKLGFLLMRSLEKIKSSLGQQYAGLVPEINEQEAQEAIEKGMNQVLEMDSLEIDMNEAADKATQLARQQLMNNATALANLLSSKVDGLDPAIIELIIAVVCQNDEAIKTSLDSLSKTLGLDPTLLHSFLALACQSLRVIAGQVNQEEGAGEIQKPNSAQVIQALKQIFRQFQIIDDRVQNILGDVCKVLVEQDVQPVVDIVQDYVSQQAPQVFDKLGVTKEDFKDIIEMLFQLFMSAIEQATSRSKGSSKFKDTALNMIKLAYENPDDDSDPSKMNVNESLQLLERIKAGDIKPFIDKNCFAGVNPEKGIIGFKVAYPVLCLLESALNALGLSNQVTVNGMKEIMMDLQLMNDKFGDKDQLIESVHTHNAYYTLPEKAYLALNYITKGNSINVKSLADQSNELKLNLIHPELRGEDLQHVAHLSSYSVQSFHQILKRMSLLDNKMILTSLYDILMGRNNGNTVQLIDKLSLRAIFGKNFFHLVQLFEGIQEFHLLNDRYHMTKKNLATLNGESVHQNRNNSAIRQEPILKEEEKLLKQQYEQFIEDLESNQIWEVRYKIVKALSKISCKYLTGDEYKSWPNSLSWSAKRRAMAQYKAELILYKEKKYHTQPTAENMKKFFQKTKQPENPADIEASTSERQNLIQEGNNNEGYLPTEEMEGSTTPETLVKPKEERQYLTKMVNIYINFSVGGEKEGAYYLKSYMFEKIIDALCEQEGCPTYQARSDICQVYDISTLLMRAQGKIPRNVTQCEEALENIADSLGIEPETLELLIDFMIGDPREVYRCDKTQVIEYDLRQIEQSTNFFRVLDGSRLKQLQRIFKGSDQTHSYFFLNWLHQYRLLQIQKETVQTLYQGEFGVSKDFLDMIKSYREIQDGTVDEQDGTTKLKRRINNLISNTFFALATGNTKALENTAFLQEVSDKTFVSKVKHPFSGDESKSIQRIELIMRIHQFYTTFDKAILQQLLDEDNETVHKMFKNLVFMKNQPTLTNVFKTVLEASEFFSNDYLMRQEFIGAQFLMSAFTVNRILRSQTQDTKYVELMASLFDGQNYNKLAFGQPPLIFEEGDEKNVYQTLYDNKFLDPSINYLMAPVLELIASRYPTKLGQKNVDHIVIKQIMNNLMGVLLGYSVDDPQMIRSSVVELLISKKISQQNLEGLLAILLKDLSCTSQIESFASKVGLSGQMLVNLMKLVDRDNRDFYTTVFLLSREVCSQEVSDTISSMLTITRFEEQLPQVLQKLKIKSPLAKVAMQAVIQKEWETFQEQLGLIKNMLKVKQIESMSQVAELIKGRPGDMLGKMSKKGFEKEMLKAYYLLQYNGHLAGDQKVSKIQLEKALANIYSGLEVFTYWAFKDFNLDAQQKETASQNASLLIMACWGDEPSLRIILSKLKQTKDHDSLWYIIKHANIMKNPSREVSFLHHCIFKLFSTLNESQLIYRHHQNSVLKHLFETFIPYIQRSQNSKNSAKEVQQMQNALQELQKHLEIDQSTKKIADQQIALLVKTFKESMKPEQVAEMIGCTFRYTGKVKVHQQIYECKTCMVKVCKVCAMLHHNADGLTFVNEHTHNEERHYCVGGEQGKSCKGNQLEIIPVQFKSGNMSINDKVAFDDDIVHDRLQKYQLGTFIEDISQALELQRYTQRDIKQEEFKGTYDTFTYTQAVMKKASNSSPIKESKVPVQTLKEARYHGRSYSLCENVILMSFGRTQGSFVKHLVKEDDPEHTYKVSVLRTLQALSSGDLEIYDLHAQEAIQKNDKPSAAEIQTYGQLLLLCKGTGYIDRKREEKLYLKSLYVNPYIQMFEKIFGGSGQEWKKILALHRYISSSEKELQTIFAEDDKNAPQNAHELVVPTIYCEKEWIYNGLFKEGLSYSQKSRIITHGLLSLILRDEKNSLNLWKIMKIPDTKAPKYMTLLFQENDFELELLAYQALPGKLSQLLVSGFCNMNASGVVEFAVNYLDRLFQSDTIYPPDRSKSKLTIDWETDFSDLIKQKVDSGSIPKTEVLKSHHRFYLTKLVELMSGEFDDKPYINVQYLDNVVRECRYGDEAVSMRDLNTKLYKFHQVEERGQFNAKLRSQNLTQVSIKDHKKFNPNKLSLTLNNFIFESLQGLELLSNEYLAHLYMNQHRKPEYRPEFLPTIEGKMTHILGKINEIRAIANHSERGINPSSILKQLRAIPEKKSIFAVFGGKKDEVQQPNLDETEMKMIGLLTSAIYNADIVKASRLVDLMTNKYTNNLFKSAIAKLTVKEIEYEKDDVSTFFDMAIKRSLSRLYEYSVRHEFSTTPKAEIDAALTKSIVENNDPLLMGVTVTRNREILGDFIPLIDKALDNASIANNENDEPQKGNKLKFNIQDFKDLIQPDAIQNNISKFLSYVCQADLMAVKAEVSVNGIVKLLLKNAGKLPILRDVFANVQDVIGKFELPKEVIDTINNAAKQVGISSISNEEIQEMAGQLVQNVMKNITYENVIDIAQNPDKAMVVMTDLSAKVDAVFDFEKLPNLKQILEKDHNIQRLIKQYKDTFMKQIGKNLLPFFGELQADFINSLYQCFITEELDLNKFKHLMTSYIEPLLSDFDSDLQQVMAFVTLLSQGKPFLAIDKLDGVLNVAYKCAGRVDQLALKVLPGQNLNSAEKVQEVNNQVQKAVDNTVKPLIALIKQWMKVVSLAVGQEPDAEVDFKTVLIVSLNNALDSTQQFLEDKGALKGDTPLTQIFAQMNLIKAAVTAIISLSQGNYEGVEPLAVILGGVPAKEGFQRLKQAIGVIQQNKDGITFSSVKSIASANMGLAFKAIPVKIPGIEKIEELIAKGVDNPASLVEPKTFFDLFKNERGVIGLDEFKNIFKTLGISMPHATVLQVFSIADIEKRGELHYHEFAKALSGIKEQLIQKFVIELGFTFQEMLMSIAFTAFILILQFVFIFIGMSAFSPTTTFSSVINSLMALGASFAAKGNEEKDRSADDVKDAVVDVTTA